LVIAFQVTVENVGDVFFETQCRMEHFICITVQLVLVYWYVCAEKKI